jgi:hypothetical protein
MLEPFGVSRITASGGISPTTSVIRSEAFSASYPENYAARGVLEAAALGINRRRRCGEENTRTTAFGFPCVVEGARLVRFRSRCTRVAHFARRTALVARRIISSIPFIYAEFGRADERTQEPLTQSPITSVSVAEDLG